MAYNIIDILDNAIAITHTSKKVYLNIDYKGQDKAKFNLIISVLIKSLDKEISYYENIKKDLKNKDLEVIDFNIYDNISLFMNQFNNKIHCEEIDNITMLVKWTAYLHKDIFALFISIQGKLVRTKKDIDTFAYRILSIVLHKKEVTIKDIESLLI